MTRGCSSDRSCALSFLLGSMPPGPRASFLIVGAGSGLKSAAADQYVRGTVAHPVVDAQWGFELKALLF